MSSIVKVKILNMEYDRDNNLFKLSLRDVSTVKHTNIAIRGTDWGITPAIPQDIVDQFCKDMIGKEKTLEIEVDPASFDEVEKLKREDISPEEMDRIHENINRYPIQEAENSIKKEMRGNEG